jgi:cation-transporting ATPase E
MEKLLVCLYTKSPIERKQKTLYTDSMNTSTHNKLKSLSYIFARNVFLLTNWIIAAVVALLFVFGDTQAGIFLGFILFINITLGLAQDIRAWLALENLELLTAPRIIRIASDGKEESVLTEEIKKGDLLKLTTGDQVPCDGILTQTQTLELNEGLITGESASLPRNTNDHILAGSIITAGNGTLRTETVFYESRIARMTEGIRNYSANQSPIQKSVDKVIQYSGYVLIGMIGFVVIRGLLTNTSDIIIVKNIGALASMIVPQGLAFAITLLFAYGAAHLYQRNVLLQEVNATEKLGRIRNLCMDKTGTLSENKLVVENITLPLGMTQEEARDLVSAYLTGLGDATETITAIRHYLKQTFSGKILETLPFSSWRRYGAVRLERTNGHQTVVIAGATNRLLPLLSQETERVWLQNLLETEAQQGKRLLCFARAQTNTILQDVSQAKLSVVAVLIFHHKLRPGIQKAIDFFQQRDVRIRIISGDGSETVQAVAKASGVQNCDRVIIGSALEHWTPDDYKRKAKNYTIFARIVPEQKEKIIEALKSDGFTAMVGDGANDALAIKKADLGIAMFEGAPATRQLASIVLTNNSFSALPGGVELADSIIKNAEIFASIFFDMAIAGFFLFIMVSMLGYPLPITPLNITLINYFTVGFPGLLVSYWTIRPAEKVAGAKTTHFLQRILPFVVSSALLQAFAMAAIFMMSSETLKEAPSNFPVVLTAITTGFIFFLFVPGVYRGKLLKSQIKALWALTLFQCVFLVFILQIPFFLRFFEITLYRVSLQTVMLFLISIVIYTLLQYLLTRQFSQK